MGGQVYGEFTAYQAQSASFSLYTYIGPPTSPNYRLEVVQSTGSFPPGMSATATYGYVSAHQTTELTVTLSGTPSQSGSFRAEYAIRLYDQTQQVKDIAYTTFAVTVAPLYTHTIAYNANGGSGSMGNTAVSDYNSGAVNLTFAANGFSAPAGHYFAGWRINNAGTVYQPGNSYAVGGNSTVTAYAYWAPYSYTVSLTAGTGGTVSGGGTYSYGSTATISATPNEGYAFTQWSDGNTNATRSITVTSDISLTAHFARSYTVTWKNWDDSILEVDTVISGTTPAYGGSTPVKPSTAQYSYIFTGWSPEITPVTNDITYTAQFSSVINTYVVSLNTEGNGTVTGAGTYDYNTTVSITAVPADGFYFINWSDGNTSSSRSITVTEDITLTAKFVSYLGADIIAFSSGGGTFAQSSAISIVDGPGTIVYDPIKGAYIWTHAPTSSQVQDGYTIRFNMAYDEDHGITPPPNMGSVMIWGTAHPYFAYDVTLDENGHAIMDYTIKKRNSSDILVNRTFYPHWTPIRDSRQTAIIVTPGYGSVDLGYIQSITETYNAQLSTIPIVCYGFSGTFCMDLGVFKQITLGFLRTCPPLEQCNDLSPDSRLWTNAKWISYLKTIMDRWQMMSNGSLFYLLRPATERPAATVDTVYDDPMVQTYPEIIAEPCYISQLPIIYDDSPQVLSGKLSLQIGTIYPRSPEAERITITYVLDATSYGKGRIVKEVEYPLVEYILLPSVTDVFGSDAIYYDPQSSTTGYIAAQWTTPAGGEYLTKTVYTLSSFLAENSSSYYEIDAVLTSISTRGGTALVTRSKVLYVTPENPSLTTTVSCVAVGGGGGGGGGDIIHADQDYCVISGGGGGASGTVETNSWNFMGRTLKITCTVGSGGEGGSAGEPFSSTRATDGYGGNPSSIKIEDNVSAPKMITALGGLPGHAAANTSDPGEGEPNGAGGVPSSADSGSMPGGNGGNNAAGADGNAESTGSGPGGAGGHYITDEFTYTFIDPNTGRPFEPQPPVYHYHMFISGGGGGGGGYCVPALTPQRCGGGGGAASSSEINSTHTTNGVIFPGYGAGGGGGGGVRSFVNATSTGGVRVLNKPYPYYGSAGGNGYCFIMVSNGRIME